MSQLTMQLPRDRPGTELSPIDKAYRARETAPTAHGTTAGIACAAWEERGLVGEPYVVAVMVDGEGHYIKQSRSDGYGGGSGKRLYRLHSDIEDVQWACIRHAHQPAPDPVGVLRRQMRQQLEDKTLRIHHDRREIDASDVESHVRRDGGRMTFHHSLQA